MINKPTNIDEYSASKAIGRLLLNLNNIQIGH